MDLSTIELFDGIGPDALRQVYSRATHRQFPAGSVICREGDPGNSMFVIESGSAQVTIAGERVRRLRQGDVIGEIAVLTGEPRSATVTATLPTDVIELHRDALSAVLASTPQLLANLTRVLSMRLATAHDRTVASRRGEAVGLVLSESLLASLKSIVASAEAACPHPVSFLQLESLESALRQLDRALSESAFVFVPVELQGNIVQTLDAHMDRVVVVVRDDAEAARLDTPDALVIEPDDPAAVAWLGRHLTRTKLGLALGAGGAKGFAHVGALAVLQDAGYTVDAVAGSSIGAIVGACLAMGRSAEEIDGVLRDRFSEETVKAVFTLSFSGASAGYDTMKELTAALAGELSFDDLRIPLTVMTVDLSTRQPVPLSEGRLDEALLAGTALAGLFPPYQRGDQRLVDGLALVPVPVDSARALGADVVVSVNIMSRETLPAWPGDEPLPPEPAGKQRMLETLLEVMDLAQLDASVRHAAKADVAITPRFGPCTWRDFHLADRFLAAGREAAQEMLPALQGLARPQTSISDQT
jgi:predicted acylesterase/phospholipase RssA/CRP-like cAMP-binding protein